MARVGKAVPGAGRPGRALEDARRGRGGGGAHGPGLPAIANRAAPAPLPDPRTFHFPAFHPPPLRPPTHLQAVHLVGQGVQVGIGLAHLQEPGGAGGSATWSKAGKEACLVWGIMDLMLFKGGSIVLPGASTKPPKYRP